MSIKISYLDSVPIFRQKRCSNTSLQMLLNEFMKTDKLVVRIELGDHYLSTNSARSTFSTAVRRSGYNLEVHLVSAENCIYIVKPNEIRSSTIRKKYTPSNDKEVTTHGRTDPDRDSGTQHPDVPGNQG